MLPVALLSAASLALALALAQATAVSGSALHAANLVYRSPLAEAPWLSHDISRIAKRDAEAAPYAGALDFRYGVASGDQTDSTAILWTHPVPAAANTSQVCLSYQVWRSKDKAPPVQGGKKKKLADSGNVITTPDIDYSIKVHSKGLRPDQEYNYRFSNCHNASAVSPTGTFKTAPAPGKSLKKVVFGVYSCSNYPEGFFSAYTSAVQRGKIDYFLHLGDYIYEGYTSKPHAPSRTLQPKREISTLEDYRQRYKTYHQDTGLLALRSSHGMYSVWDDHEVADNTWKGGSADSNDTVQGEVNGVKFTQRKINALKAWNEWIPASVQPTDKDFRIWRKFTFGTLFELDLWDTRQYQRDLTDVYYNTAEVAKIKDQENRTLMGFDQEAWAFANLHNNKVDWHLIGQQIIVNQLYELSGKTPDFDLDAWDGYTANRRRFINTLKQNKISNTIVLSGDSHAAWVYEGSLPEDLSSYNPATGDGSVFVEFAGTAVSSSSSYGRNLTQAAYDERAKQLTLHNKNLHYADGARRGYFELTVTPKYVEAEYLGVPAADQLQQPSPVQSLGKFRVNKDTNRLVRPINGGKAPSSGVIQDQAVGDYAKHPWNGTAFN